MSACIRAFVARGEAEVAACQRIRRDVYVVETGLLRPDTTEHAREVDEEDDRVTTVHILVCVDGEEAATVRLLLPSRRVVGAIGVEMGARYDLAPLAVTGVAVAEGSRMAVLPAHRGGPVFGALIGAMVDEGLRLGLTHLVAAANAETDSIEDAEIAYRIAERDELLSDRFRVVPRPGASGQGPSVRGIYTAEERARARAGDLRGLKLPRTLQRFATHLEARFMGPPIREPGYAVCSLPVVVDLARAARAQALRRVGT